VGIDGVSPIQSDVRVKCNQRLPSVSFASPISSSS
jgi:hypothetical protein